MAAVTFNTEDRLSQIVAPTLVLSGTEDRVVPPRNSEMLAEKIPGARLDLIPGAGHLGFIEHAGRFNQDVIEFLNE
jgi:pimeloyl-ACP methyl ester carboxylesterase